MNKTTQIYNAKHHQKQRKSDPKKVGKTEYFLEPWIRVVLIVRFTSETSSRESTRRERNPRYPGFILTPTELGDPTA